MGKTTEEKANSYSFNRAAEERDEGGHRRASGRTGEGVQQVAGCLELHEHGNCLHCSQPCMLHSSDDVDDVSSGSIAES